VCKLGTADVGLASAGYGARAQDGTSCYLNGNTWFARAHGANGVYYRVVAAP